MEVTPSFHLASFVESELAPSISRWSRREAGSGFQLFASIQWLLCAGAIHYVPQKDTLDAMGALARLSASEFDALLRFCEGKIPLVLAEQVAKFVRGEWPIAHVARNFSRPSGVQPLFQAFLMTGADCWHDPQVHVFSSALLGGSDLLRRILAKTVLYEELLDALVYRESRGNVVDAVVGFMRFLGSRAIFKQLTNAFSQHDVYRYEDRILLADLLSQAEASRWNIWDPETFRQLSQCITIHGEAILTAARSTRSSAFDSISDVDVLEQEALGLTSDAIAVPNWFGESAGYAVGSQNVAILS